MKTYQVKYRGKDGKSKKGRCYSLTFADRVGVRRRLQAYTQKDPSVVLGQEIEKVMQNAGRLDTDTQKEWFAGLLPRIRNKLMEWGIVDQRTTTNETVKPLAGHLEDFLNSKRADKRGDAYISQLRMSITNVLDGCGFKLWTDIDAEAVKRFIAKDRGPDGYGERTYNTYLRAFRTFTRWLDEIRGLPDRMKKAKLLKQTEYRKQRRALTLDEIDRLYAVTESAPERFGMTGHERALVYRLALDVGLRAGEIKSLQVLSFDFDKKTVRIEAKDTKGKTAADLMLTDETAGRVQEYLKGKGLADRAFNIPLPRAAEVLKKDLADAGIEYRDAAGRDVDFHSLRHTYISHLALANVHPRVAQKLARHTTIELTMKYYTHVLHESEVQAVKALETLRSKQDKKQTKQTA